MSLGPAGYAALMAFSGFGAQLIHNSLRRRPMFFRKHARAGLWGHNSPLTDFF